MEWMILPLKRYAQFSGRSTRREFWMWVLFLVIVSIMLAILDSVLGLGGATEYGGSSLNTPTITGYGYGAGVHGGWLTNIFGLAVIIPNIAVSVRRLHDTDRSGWWILLPMAPYFAGAALMFMGSLLIGGILAFGGFVCAIVLLVWYCTRGTTGPNRFGPDPLSPTGDLHDTFS